MADANNKVYCYIIPEVRECGAEFLKSWFDPPGTSFLQNFDQLLKIKIILTCSCKPGRYARFSGLVAPGGSLDDRDYIHSRRRPFNSGLSKCADIFGFVSDLHNPRRSEETQGLWKYGR
jgi:hypothetical protein